ncbi:MAG: peptidylprolyl isomerase [Vallitalea sp.]|jgi:foldase protein PrsA|nr:peptidylprolyl isomerase [Vallitalea sp.]
MKSTYKYISKYILLFILIFLFTGCSGSKDSKNDSKIYSYQERLLTIDGKDISVDEVMPYLLQVKMEFEELGGEDVWDHNDFSGGKKAKDVARLAVLDNITRTKILVRKASEIGINITKEEENEIRIQSLKYYNGLQKAEKDKYHLTKDSIFNSFKEFKIANKVFVEMTKEYVPEEKELMEILSTNEDYISLKSSDVKEILKKIKVKHIFIKTHSINEKGEYTLISKNILEEAKKVVEKVHNKAVAGENFDALINKYSEDKQDEYIFVTRFIKDEFKSLLELEIGQISNILKSNYGYHIFQMVEKIDATEDEITKFKNNFDKWEQQLKEEYTKQLTNNAFNEIYDEWKSNTIVDLNEELWVQIDIFGNINNE